MSGTVATVQSEAILKELGQVWRSLGKQDAQGNPVLRACAMTLLVVDHVGSDTAAVNETLAALMHEHPSRAIVLRIGEGGVLDARVLAQCWMPFGSRQQICCEQIEITAGQDRIEEVATALLGLTVPDLPIVVWFRRASLMLLPEVRPVLRLADKLIVDAGTELAIVRALDELRKQGMTLIDLAWTRLTPWRETIARQFDDQDAASVSSARVRHDGPVPRVSGHYLGAWLAEVLRVPVEFAPGAQEQVLLASGAEPLVTITCAAGNSVDITTPSLTSRIVFPPSNEYELLRQELTILGRDTLFEAVLARTAKGLSA